MASQGWALLDGAPLPSFLSGNDGFDGDGRGTILEEVRENIDTDTEIPFVVNVTQVPLQASLDADDWRGSDFVIDVDDMNIRGFSWERGEDDSQDDGITILSSVTSLMNLQQHQTPTSSCKDTTPRPEILAQSPYAPLSTDHALSISTTDSVFTAMMMINSAPRSTSERALQTTTGRAATQNPCSFFSCHDASSRSSLLSFSLPSSVPSNAYLSNMYAASSESQQPASYRDNGSDDEQSWVLVSSRCTFQDSVGEQELNMIPSRPFWYEALTTEHDWEVFRDQGQQILVALGVDCGNMSPDELLALLIQQEEEQLWSSNRDKNHLYQVCVQQHPYWPLVGWKFMEFAFVAASAAVASIGAYSLVRRRIVANAR
jgi:hypothetical protein